MSNIERIRFLLGHIEEKDLSNQIHFCYRKTTKHKPFPTTSRTNLKIPERSRLGFSYKKPKLIPGKLDTNKQEEFRLQYSLLKGNLSKDEAILIRIHFSGQVD